MAIVIPVYGTIQAVEIGVTSGIVSEMDICFSMAHFGGRQWCDIYRFVCRCQGTTVLGNIQAGVASKMFEANRRDVYCVHGGNIMLFKTNVVDGIR